MIQVMVSKGSVFFEALRFEVCMFVDRMQNNIRFGISGSPRPLFFPFTFAIFEKYLTDG